MNFEINWMLVSLSFAAASIVYYLYLWVLALIKKRQAERQVKICEARLQRLIDALKERQARFKGA